MMLRMMPVLTETGGPPIFPVRAKTKQVDLGVSPLVGQMPRGAGKCGCWLTRGGRLLGGIRSPLPTHPGVHTGGKGALPHQELAAW